MRSKVGAKTSGDSIGRRLSFLLCKVGLHNWGHWQKVQVEHLGEYPWETWRHLCHSDQRACSFCGKRSRRRRTCQGPRVALPDQRR